MEITFLGHAGLHIRTSYGSILCDPWTNPAYLESWYPFPANHHLKWTCFGKVDYLYISHLHEDHFDRKLLSQHVNRDAIVLLPSFPTSDLRTELRRLGFSRFWELPDSVVSTRHGLRVMIQVIRPPTEGALGDSLLAIDDGTARLLNQNDARPVDLSPILRFGHFDIHFLQFSGANWWPWSYELPYEVKYQLGAAKRNNSLDRALGYVKAIDARLIVPCAGPPCFLDKELFYLNDIAYDSANTFPDQEVFLGVLRREGIDNGLLLIPGATIDASKKTQEIRWPSDASIQLTAFSEKASYLMRYARQVREPRERPKGQTSKTIDILTELKRWFDPLLRMADSICTRVGGNVKIDIDEQLCVVIDFNMREVRACNGESCRYGFRISRTILERLITEHRVDWVNSLFLSMRFTAFRSGPFNEYLYLFFTCLDAERLSYAERWHSGEGTSTAEVRLGNWMVQRYCPHQRADLSRFGRVDQFLLTCTMHGWQFDLRNGRCLVDNDKAHAIRSRYAPDG